MTTRRRVVGEAFGKSKAMVYQHSKSGVQILHERGHQHGRTWTSRACHPLYSLSWRQGYAGVAPQPSWSAPLRSYLVFLFWCSCFYFSVGGYILAHPRCYNRDGFSPSGVWVCEERCSYYTAGGAPQFAAKSAAAAFLQSATPLLGLWGFIDLKLGFQNLAISLFQVHFLGTIEGILASYQPRP